MSERILGVLGGMGPLASAHFMLRLLAERRPAMRLRVLRDAGCGAIAIPCNTAHGWAEALEEGCGLPVLHIVDATAAELRRALRPGAGVGLLGTAATLRIGLFQERLQPQGWRCLVPDADEMVRLVMPAIDAVKAGRVAETFAPVMRVVRSLQERGAEAVVLGCTELPLSLAAGPDGADALRMRPPVIVDTIDALARLSIAWARGQQEVAAAA